jgi:hypothetical protein
MTTAAETTVSEKEAEKAAKEARAKEIAAKEAALNKDKSGKGLRFFVGFTRGRSTQMVEYENWDEAQTDTLPLSLSEFMDIRKISDEKEIVKRLILGDNELLYKEASDPVAEFVDLTWPEDIQKNFRIVVRNYATGANVSIEDAANLIKPAYLASQAKAAAK